MNEKLNLFIRENYSPWLVREFTKTPRKLEAASRSIAENFCSVTDKKVHPIMLELEVQDSLVSYSNEIITRIPITRSEDAAKLFDKAVGRIQEGFSQRIKALRTGKPNIDKHIIEDRLRAIRPELSNSIVIICEMIAAESAKKEPDIEKLHKYHEWKQDCITAARERIEGRISELQQQIQESKQPKIRKAPNLEAKNTRPSDATRIPQRGR